MSGLTTHVLDTAHGKPAAGMIVELHRLDNAGDTTTLRLRITLNEDGRADAPLLTGAQVVPGTYELRFFVGDYFASQGAAQSEPRFLDVVPLRFGLADPHSHYHVPLLVSPWSYATYRGS